MKFSTKSRTKFFAHEVLNDAKIGVAMNFIGVTNTGNCSLRIKGYYLYIQYNSVSPYPLGMENKYVRPECTSYPNLLNIGIHINLQTWLKKLVRTKPKYVLTQVRTNRVLL